MWGTLAVLLLCGYDVFAAIALALLAAYASFWLGLPLIILQKDKRESPRLQSWDESASMFFLILDISDYGISRNASDRLAEIRTRP